MCRHYRGGIFYDKFLLSQKTHFTPKTHFYAKKRILPQKRIIMRKNVFSPQNTFFTPTKLFLRQNFSMPKIVIMAELMSRFRISEHKMLENRNRRRINWETYKNFSLSRMHLNRRAYVIYKKSSKRTQLYDIFILYNCGETQLSAIFTPFLNFFSQNLFLTNMVFKTSQANFLIIAKVRKFKN